MRFHDWQHRTPVSLRRLADETVFRSYPDSLGLLVSRERVFVYEPARLIAIITLPPQKTKTTNQ